MRFGDYAPENFDKRYRGELTAREALQLSLNLPAVALLDRLGPMRLVGTLEAAGIAAAPARRRRRAGIADRARRRRHHLEDLVDALRRHRRWRQVLPLRYTGRIRRRRAARHHSARRRPGI